MRLSEEIFKKGKFPVVKGNMFNQIEGYDIPSVELYLEQVGTRVEKIENENQTLKEQIKTLLEEKELRGTSTTSDSSGDEISSEVKDDVKKKLKQIETLERSYKRMLYIAEEESEEIREEARQEARKLLEEARDKAESLIREANNRFTEKEREITNLTTREEEVKVRLKNIYSFIEETVS